MHKSTRCLFFRRIAGHGQLLQKPSGTGSIRKERFHQATIFKRKDQHAL